MTGLGLDNPCSMYSSFRLTARRCMDPPARLRPGHRAYLPGIDGLQASPDICGSGRFRIWINLGIETVEDTGPRKPGTIIIQQGLSQGRGKV